MERGGGGGQAGGAGRGVGVGVERGWEWGGGMHRKRVPGHLGVKLPATPAPPSPPQLTAVSHRGLIPDVSAQAGDIKKTVQS